MTTMDLHSLTGAYALHALPEDERAAFEGHLHDCASCGQEIAEFAATAERLALASTVRARPDMRDQVLHRITTVRQAPPTAAPTERVRRLLPHGSGAVRWALAACLAGATALGGTAAWQYERAQDAQQQAAQAERHADEITAVLTAPDARTRSARVGGGSGTLVVSADRDQAVFLAGQMPEPPRGKVYQLWFDDAGTMRPAGLMDPGRRDQTVLLSGAVGSASGVGVTVEPAGGSPRPTAAPISLLNMPA
ncbi:anti-sigma factor [Streptomyces sp. NPDC046985]|uniref:anti-sigma factor n=1 Tax=Streptomyces sp. NPDC046985 TaxID=3155377 RepID=UPI0033E6C74B